MRTDNTSRRKKASAALQTGLMLILTFGATSGLCEPKLPASPEAGWMYLTETDGAEHYFNGLMFAKSARGAKGWALANFFKAQSGDSGRFRSLLRQYEVDCSAGQIRSLQLITHARVNRAGEVVDTSRDAGEWSEPPPQTVDEAFLRYSCKAIGRPLRN